MTREEICKVLECCSSHKYLCNECPLDQRRRTDYDCGTFCMGEALTLIKELTEENKKITINMNAYGLTAKRLAEENERLSKEVKYWETETKEARADIDQSTAEARADTVRKMQERVKQAVKDIPWCEYPPVHNCIDQIAKEMLEETK